MEEIEIYVIKCYFMGALLLFHITFDMIYEIKVISIEYFLIDYSQNNYQGNATK